MKGHIRRRGRNSWAIVFDLGRDPETGKRRQQWHTIKGTKRDAERASRELLHSLETGSYARPQRVTLGEYVGEWLRDNVQVRCSPRTVENYQSIVQNHLLPSLGTLRLSQLKPQHLQGYYARALCQGRVDGQGGLSAASVLRHHRILSQALKHAVRQNLVARIYESAISVKVING